MNNTDRHPECHMRTALGNCDPIGGFCTSVSESVCEGLHKVSRPQGKWIVRFPYEDTGKTRTCSNCNITQTVNVYDGMVRFKFCPYCGARMKGTEGE